MSANEAEQGAGGNEQYAPVTFRAVRYAVAY